MPQTILIVDDEKNIRLTLGGLLADEGYLVAHATSGPEALERIDESAPEAIILDLWMEGYEQGFEVLDKIRLEYPNLPVLVISGHGNIETAVQAVQAGAFDYLEKPLSAEKILLSLEKALKFKAVTDENIILKDKSIQEEMIGQSKSMKALKEQIALVAPTQASVLITGENGVGKELAAKLLHRLSKRNFKPMIEVNCAAIPEDLVESELFGHEKGAFTGALNRRQGRFDLAHNSTLFLDEIADMSLKTQAKILRILQEQKFERVGGNKTINVDVRIIAATNKDLPNEIKKGNFREDLYYRLNVFPLNVPPLRERVEDIPILADIFLKRYIQANNLGNKKFSSNLFEDFKNRSWPGNVRELKNTVERLAIMSSGEIIDKDITAQQKPALNLNQSTEQDYLEQLDYKDAKSEFEKRYLSIQLKKYKYNISQTAEAINLDRTSLHKKLKALGIKGDTENN